MNYILWYLLIISLIAFFVCGHDKRAAQRHKRRVSEGTLFLLSALGGAYGMLAGMLCFRHKTKHTSFLILIPLFCVIWTAAIILLLKSLYFT